jgi:DNA repair protein RecO (recombination protein O)
MLCDLMEWREEAIILAARPHGETSLILQVLTHEHGRHAGLVRGARRARGRGVYETGNLIVADWRARLADHLGTLRCELLRGYAAGLIDDPARLSCLAAAAALAEAALPEREAAPGAFLGLAALLDSLAADRGWEAAYVAWELALLAELGFGLDLSRCAATGATSDLAYVSPKSAQAVSRDAGAPYRDKLLPLPGFLLAGGASPAPDAIRDGLALTGFFLTRHIFEPLDRKMPAARTRFVDRMRQGTTISGSNFQLTHD